MINVTSATKEMILQEVKEFLPKLRKIGTKESKALADSISYASNMYKKDATKVTKKSLVDFFNEANKMLAMPVSATKEKATPKATSAAKDKPKASLKKAGEKVVEQKKVENLTKKTVSKVEKSKSEKEEPAKKPTTKAKTEKTEEVKTEKPKTSKKTVPVEVEANTFFPATLEVETEDGKQTYKVDHTIKDMKSISKLVDKDVDLVIAFHYSKDEVKKYYPRFNEKSKGIKSFENDLDLTYPVFIDDDFDLMYVVSMYSSCFYSILHDEVEEDDGVRCAGGTFYQIYRA